jgi:hypothetical protein
MLFGDSPTIRSNITPPSSGQKNKTRKKPTEAGEKMQLASATFFLAHSLALKINTLCFSEALGFM